MTHRPGQKPLDKESMIRVDQAGEFGATRIYAGQLAVLPRGSAAAHEVARMAAQEERHRARFDQMVADRGVRPTALQPFWDKAGFALGAVTALISPKAAMACTDAVETEIDRHYAEQLEALGEEDGELSEIVAQFREEELEHKEIALAHGAADAPAYPLLHATIRGACRFAINLSKKI